MQQQIDTFQKIMDVMVDFFVNYSFQVLGAILVLILGAVLGNWLSNLLLGFMQKKNLDITLSKFLAGTVKLIVVAFAVIVALGKFGISTAPMVAAVSAMAFGASFAIKGPLSNYGAGISIILSRPFTVGQTITVKEVSGVVQEVKLACTKLINEDGVLITVPNNHIVGEVLYNSGQNKVVESVVGISYDSDSELAILAVRETLNGFSEVVKNPAPQIGIQSFGDSSINIGYRYWIPTIKYYQLSFSVNSAILKALRNAKISIPFPQREVRLLNPANV